VIDLRDDYDGDGYNDRLFVRLDLPGLNRLAEQINNARRMLVEDLERSNAVG